MKRFLTVFIILLVLTGAVYAEGSQEEMSSETEYSDGIYFAQEDQFNAKTGWKYNVTIEVEKGRITSALWNGSHVKAGNDKVTRSKSGEYGMVAKGGAMAPWFEQAAAAEAYLLETQDPADISYKDDKGHTDAFSGATIHVIEFFDLAEKALAAGPAGYGPYKDGSYHAQLPDFHNGYKYFVDLTVISGYIVAADWDAYAEDGGDNKEQRSIDGTYGMVEKAGAIAPWFEQAGKVEETLLNSQSTEMPDAISGATIGLDPFYTLVKEALSGAKR